MALIKIINDGRIPHGEAPFLFRSGQKLCPKTENRRSESLRLLMVYFVSRKCAACQHLPVVAYVRLNLLQLKWLTVNFAPKCSKLREKTVQMLLICGLFVDMVDKVDTKYTINTRTCCQSMPPPPNFRSAVLLLIFLSFG